MIDRKVFVPDLARAIRKILPTLAPLVIPGEVIEAVQYRNSERIHFTMEAPKDYGIFASIIKSTDVRVYGEELAEGGWWLVVGLSYEHTGGGSNGYTIATLYLDKDFEFVQARMEGGGIIKAEALAA